MTFGSDTVAFGTEPKNCVRAPPFSPNPAKVTPRLLYSVVRGMSAGRLSGSVTSSKLTMVADGGGGCSWAVAVPTSPVSSRIPIDLRALIKPPFLRARWAHADIRPGIVGPSGGQYFFDPENRCDPTRDPYGAIVRPFARDGSRRQRSRMFLMPAVPCSMRTSMSPARSSGIRSAIQTNRLRRCGRRAVVEAARKPTSA